MPFATINQKSLFYTDDEQHGGAASKTTTLLIHGLGSSSCFYKTITPQLQSVSRCIALDTPGSGLSQLGTSEQSTSSIAEDAIGLLDHLNIREKIVVVGHSMGGIVASQIAVSYPDRVKGVVLLGPVNPRPEMADVFEKRIEAVQKGELYCGGLEGLAATIPLAATGKKAGPLHQAFIRSLILGTSPAGYVSLCRVISTAKQPEYDAIKVPLLIIAGEDDKTAPLASSEAILNGYATKSDKKAIEILDGIGHWHCVEAPADVERLIKGFIQKSSS